MRHPYHLAICLGLVVAAGSWGLYWLPQRFLESRGLTGGWGTIAQMGIALLTLTPFTLWRVLRGKTTGLGFPIIGLLMGGGYACYANSFLLTEVMRALILFFLIPLWTTLFEICFLGKRPGIPRLISLLLAFSGLWIVLAREFFLPIPENWGDWLALIGGGLFAGGALRLEKVQPKSTQPILFAFFLYGTIVTLGLSLLLTTELGPMPSTVALLSMAPWLFILSVGFFIPTNAIILWSPSRVGAGLFSILILSEIVVGTVSAGLLADDPFGWREVVGGILILLAGLVETLFSLRSKVDAGSFHDEQDLSMDRV